MADSVNKSALIDALVEECVVANSFEVREVLDVLPTVIQSFLKEDKTVNLNGICKVVPEQRAETMRRNPRTGESVLVPPHRVAKFKANAALKAAIR